MFLIEADDKKILPKRESEGRLFVCDNYQKGILDIFSTKNKYIPDLYHFENVSAFPRDGLLDEMLEKGFCMMVRPNKHIWDKDTKSKFSKFTRLAIEKTKDKNFVIYSTF